LQLNLPRLLVEKLELAESVQIQQQDSLITVEMVGSVLHSGSNKHDNQTRVHAQIGCLLTSAIACVLAKATGKPITILTETQIPKTRTTTIEYLMGGER